MYEKLYENLHSSLTVFAQGLIADRQILYPGVPIAFIDWEAHANIAELPETDLIGLTAITLTEDSPHLFQGSFTLGMSTFATDKNLFRLRNYVGKGFSSMRPECKIPLYDAAAASQLGWLYIVDGTTVLPMTKADTRPLQFIQAGFVFEPVSAAGG